MRGEEGGVNNPAWISSRHKKWGETPCAFIELGEGLVANEEDLDKHCRNLLAGFKIPRHYVFCELPKTSTGKIQKFLLRKETEKI